MAKKYRTLIDAIGHGGVVCAGAIFEFDEKKGEYQDKNSRWWYHKEFVETSPLIFEEVVEKEFVLTDEEVASFAIHYHFRHVGDKDHHLSNEKEAQAVLSEWKDYRASKYIPSGKGTANDVLNTEEKLSDEQLAKATKEYHEGWIKEKFSKPTANDVLNTDFINDSLASQEKFLNKLAADAILSGSPLNTEKEWVVIGTRKREDANAADEIYSVKRLSDGEVFSVGDGTNWGQIQEFVIENGKLVAAFEKWRNGSRIRRYISDLKKTSTPTELLKKENYYNDLRDADKWRKKERIELRGSDFNYKWGVADGTFIWYQTIQTDKKIPEEKIPLLTEAFEKILNYE